MNFNRNEREQEIVIETLTFQLEEERKRRVLAENKLHETEEKLRLSEMQKTELENALMTKEEKSNKNSNTKQTENPANNFDRFQKFFESMNRACDDGK